MVVIIDMGTGNLGSIQNMLKKIKVKSVISSDKSVIENAAKLVLPGVGAFDNGMKNLHQKDLVDILQKKVVQHGTPILGICLGMHLMANKSDEGDVPGLGWIDADVLRFNYQHQENNLKVPHMRWNTINLEQKHPLFEEMDPESRFYFVHSYYVRCNSNTNVLATTQYGIRFTSAIVKNNIIGVQFHPEKSHKFGMKVLKNFSEL